MMCTRSLADCWELTRNVVPVRLHSKSREQFLIGDIFPSPLSLKRFCSTLGEWLDLCVAAHIEHLRHYAPEQ